jgi:hypothetical protein
VSDTTEVNYRQLKQAACWRAQAKGPKAGVTGRLAWPRSSKAAAVRRQLNRLAVAGQNTLRVLLKLAFPVSVSSEELTSCP